MIQRYGGGDKKTAAHAAIVAQASGQEAFRVNEFDGYWRDGEAV